MKYWRSFCDDTLTGFRQFNTTNQTSHSLTSRWTQRCVCEWVEQVVQDSLRMIINFWLFLSFNSLSLPVCLFLPLFLFLSLPVCLSIYLSVSLSRLSLPLPVCLSYFLSVCRSLSKKYHPKRSREDESRSVDSIMPFIYFNRFPVCLFAVASQILNLQVEAGWSQKLLQVHLLCDWLLQVHLVFGFCCDSSSVERTLGSERRTCWEPELTDCVRAV